MGVIIFTLVLSLLASWAIHCSHVPMHHLWRYRQARTIVADLMGQGAWQAPQHIRARLHTLDRLAFEELLLECFAARGHKVIRNRRYTGDGGIDGQVILRGRHWLIHARRDVGVIRPRQVEAFATLCRRQHMSGVLIHTGHSGGLGRALLERHPHIAVISGRRLIALVTGKSLVIDGVEL